MKIVTTVDGQHIVVADVPISTPLLTYCAYVALPRAFQPPCPACGKYPPPCPYQSFWQLGDHLAEKG